MAESGEITLPEGESIESWIERAGEHGDAYTQAQVGDCYLNGYCGLDPSRAPYWYKRAADQGCEEAIAALINIYSEVEVWSGAVPEFVQEQAEKGNKIALGLIAQAKRMS